MLSAITLMPSAEAGLYNEDVDETIKADMLVHPDRYLRSSSMGTGAVLCIDKASIDIEKYAPPHYIINFKAFTISYPPRGEWVVQFPTYYKLYFNWNDRKAYIYGRNYDTGEEGWQELSKDSINRWRFVQVANDVFKIAYNMDFFPPENR